MLNSQVTVTPACNSYTPSLGENCYKRQENDRPTGHAKYIYIATKRGQS